MRNKICTICTAALALPLAACGGGGGNAGSASSPPSPTTTAGNLDVYAGTWTSACASHAVDTVSIKRAAGTNNALTIGVTRTYYATTTCTGDAIATQTWSADATATYVGTVTSSINPGPGLALLPATIDKMVAQLPQRTVTLVGTYVTHKTIDGEANWCIDYAGGSVCVPDRLYPAEAAPFDGLVVQGSDLYEVKANGTNYDAVERLTKQ